MDYTKRFKVASDIFTSHIGGPIYFTKIVDRKVETIDDSDTDEVKEENEQRGKKLSRIHMRDS